MKDVAEMDLQVVHTRGRDLLSQHPESGYPPTWHHKRRDLLRDAAIVADGANANAAATKSR